jgi:hypothetical protein
MAQNISVRLDVSKIDKSKLYKGEKGTYLDAAIIMKDEPDQYGNIGMIVQSVTKEEREQGVKGSILGNVKYIGNKPTQQQSSASSQELENDLPF